MAKINETKNAAFRISPALVVFVVLVLGVVLAVAMLYPVARDHYFAQRSNDKLVAEYKALVFRNVKIKDKVAEMQTPVGIESRAREEFGWVKAGEEAVNITGLTISESSTKLPPAIEPGSVEAPEHWWTESLDEFFGFEEVERTKPYPDDTIPGL
jgi:cell division protein FtsB